MAAVQRRTGPYNVGYFGLLQSMDDGLKLVKNEVIIPKKSSCILFLVVPNLFFYCSLILFYSYRGEIRYHKVQQRLCRRGLNIIWISTGKLCHRVSAPVIESRMGPRLNEST